MGFYGFLVRFLTIAFVQKAVAESLAHFLLENADTADNLRAVRGIAELERAHLPALLALVPGSTILVPTDTAWNAHDSWERLVSQDAGVRHRLMQTGITIPGQPIRLADGKTAATLRATTVSYALIPPAQDGLPHTLCLIRSRQPLVLTGCAPAIGPTSFENASVYYMDDFVLKDELRRDLEFKAARLRGASFPVLPAIKNGDQKKS